MNTVTPWVSGPDVINGFFAAAIWQIFSTIAVLLAAKFTASTGHLSLRTRIALGNSLIAVATVGLIRFGYSAYLVVVLMIVSSIIVTHYVLRDLSHLGLANAFRSTARGIGPEESLKQVKHTLSFLGIGAKKLQETKQFAPMVDRVRSSGGKVRLLLSSPKNPALADVADKNGKDAQTYASRVRESIIEILHQAQRLGPNAIEIRLYELHSAFAMPHFRLMLIDDEKCIYSHLVWNDSEGNDNPQLLLRRKHLGGDQESLYFAYQKYFEDLWDSKDTVAVTDASDPVLAI